MKSEPQNFIAANCTISSPPHVPEIRLHLATQQNALWHQGEEALEALGLPSPYWAFAWAGGQGLARYMLDNPDCVAGKSVLDFASGSGLVAIAAKIAGANAVTANDIDHWAGTATAMNTRLNNTTIANRADALLGRDDGWQVILAGDVFYDQSLAADLIPWFDALSARGATVLVGDPGRAYCPRQRLKHLATYQVPVVCELEDADVKRTSVWQFV